MMPKKPRSYFKLVMYLAPQPGQSESIDTEIPDGAYVTAEIIEDIDMRMDEDWEQVGFNMMLALQRRVRQNGWPGPSGDPAFDAPQEDRDTPAQTPPPAPAASTKQIDEQPPDPPPEPAERDPGEIIDTKTHCWNCGSMLVVTANRTFCPQGCSGQSEKIEPEAIPAPRPTSQTPVTHTSGGPERPYQPTPESPKPESYPENEVIPPTD